MNFIEKNCWNRDDLDDYFTTESRQKDKTIFNETHLTIDKIRVIKKPLNISKEYISEIEFLNDILLNTKINDNKKTYIIEGETGSGKSEFCQWIEYNLPLDRVPILFTRTHTSIKQIFKKLSEYSGKDYQIEEDLTNFKIESLFKLLEAECELFYQSQKQKDKNSRVLRGKFLNYFEKIYRHKDFTFYIKQNLRKYQESKEKLLKIYEPIKLYQLKAIIEDLKFNLNEEEKIDLNKIIRSFLNELFIKRFASKEDITQILIDLSKQNIESGKRLVLIFEDITSMGIYKDQILQFIFDKSKTAGKVDIIIGVTTGFVRENNLKMDTYMDRTDGYFTLTSEKGDYTYFLEDNKENIVKLTLKYMKAIKKNCQNCSEKKLCFKIFGEYLFPFTKKSLLEIYDHLIVDETPKRTPRLLLEKVQKKILYDRIFPFENPFIKEFSGYFTSEKIEIHPTLIKLFNIYGTEEHLEGKENIFLSIPKEILKFFSINIDKDVFRELEIIESDNKLYLETKKTINETIKSRNGDDDDDDKIKKQKMMIREYFTKWKSEGEPFPYGNNLKEGITSILLSKHNFLVIKSTTSQKKTLKFRYSGKLPLFIEDIDERRQEAIFRLNISRKTGNNLLDLCLEYSLDPDPINLNKLAQKYLKSRYILLEWIDNNFNQYQNQIKKNINTSLNGLNLDEIAIFLKLFVFNILFGEKIDDFSCLKKNLNRIDIPQIEKYCLNCNKYLNDIICPHCFYVSNPPLINEDLKNLIENIKFIEGLFQTSFQLGKDILNYNKLKNSFDNYKNNFENFIQSFEHMREYTHLNPNIKLIVNQDEISLKDLINFIYNLYFKVKRNLRKNNIRVHLANLCRNLEDISQYQENFSIEEIKLKLKELRNNFSIGWREEWSKVIEFKNYNFEDFFNILNESIEYFETIQNENNDIFNLICFFNKSLRKITSNYINELNFFKNLKTIFKTCTKHENILRNSEYLNIENRLKELKNEYFQIIKDIIEDLKNYESFIR
ncbi:MAG: hypothetical protein ACTSRP_03540 [Candidatus Helarchaeota archaeon]